MRLIGHPTSGNVYKVQLLLGYLGQSAGEDYELDPVKWGTPEIQSPAFLALNPAGRVPVWVDEDGPLPESNAILFHLARGSSFWPHEAVDQAQVLRWLFWEQYSHEPYIAVVRYLRHFGERGPETEAKIAAKAAGCKQALEVMEGHLSSREFFTGDAPTIADIALYAYTHVAHEAGFPLDAYPSIQAWCKRMEAIPGYLKLVDYRTP